MNNINWYFVCVFIPCIGVIFSILSIIKKYLNDIVDLKLMKSFQEYETLMEYYFEKAYVTIYKDNIMVYSVEGMSPKEEDIKNIQHRYLELLGSLMGDWLMNQLIKYYGDRHTLYVNALTYFDAHYENDAVKEAAINKQLQEAQ
jgi:hypothetical protein